MTEPGGEGFDLTKISRVLAHLVAGTVLGLASGGVGRGLLALGRSLPAPASWLVHAVNVAFLTLALYLAASGLARGKHRLVHATMLAALAALLWLTLGSVSASC